MPCPPALAWRKGPPACGMQGIIPCRGELGGAVPTNSQGISPVKKCFQGFGRALARRVGKAVRGSSGQGCRGYRPRISARTAG